MNQCWVMLADCSMFVKQQLGMHGRLWLIIELGESMSVVVLEEQRRQTWT